MNATSDAVVTHFDSKFTTTVETPGCKVDRSDDCASVIGEKKFCVKLQIFQFMYLDAHVVEYANTPDAFDQLFFFQRVRGTHHHLNFYSAPACAHQALNNHRILIPFVLYPQSVPHFINELRYSLSPIACAPDKV